MGISQGLLLGRLTSFVSGLRFPTLFAIVAAVFLADLIVPDLIPFADEIMLGLVTALLAALRKRQDPVADTSRTIDVEPLTENDRREGSRSP